MLPLLRHAFTRRVFATLLFELFALNFSFVLLIQARMGLWQVAYASPLLTVSFALVCSFVVQFSLWSFGLYSHDVVYSGQRLASNLIGAFIFSAILLYPTCAVFSFTSEPIFTFTHKFYVIALGAFMSVIALERVAVLALFHGRPYLGNVLVLGTGPGTQKLLEDTANSHSYSVAGILSEDRSQVGTCEIAGQKVIGTFEDFDSLASAHYDTVLISSSPYSVGFPMNKLLQAKLAGTQILDARDFYESKKRKLLLERLEPVQLLLSENLRMTRFRWFLKDSLEKLVALLLLLATWPLMVIATILIKVSSPGPVFFVQERIGRDGQRIHIVKFRTMAIDAEKEGAQWAKQNDPRITWIGRFLRKTRIDELPQIFNVLRGEMAFIGPRPERPEFCEMLAEEIPFYDQRHLVKPGLTGWAQVCYPYGASVEDAREKLRYDLYYIKHMSIFFDVLIVLTTIRTVLFKAYGR